MFLILLPITEREFTSHQEQTCGSDAPPCVALKGGSRCLVPVKREEDPADMVTSGQPGSSFTLDRTDNMQRAYRLNQREQIILDLQQAYRLNQREQITLDLQQGYRLNQRDQIILDLQVHHLDTQASSSVMGINKEIRMLKGALQQTKRSTGSSADVLETSARERQEATPEPRRIMMYGAWVGQRSLRTRSTLQSELMRNAARMRRRYERGHVDLSSIASAQERKNILKTTKEKLDHPSRPMNAKPTTLSHRERRATKDNPAPCQTKAPNKLQNSSACIGHYEPTARPFSADVAHLRHKLEKSRLHFGWTRRGQHHTMMTSRPRTSSDVTSPLANRELDQYWGAPSDLYSHDSHQDDDSRPSTRAGTWAFLTDAMSTKGGKKSHSNCYPSNRTKKSSNVDRGFPAKPGKPSRRGRRKSRPRATKVKQPNASSNVSTKAGRGSKTRPSSPRYASGRRGSLKNSPSRANARSKSVESRSPRSPQKVKSKERRPTSGSRKSRSSERDQMPSSSREATPRAGGSTTRVQHADRKAKNAVKQVATGSASKDKADTTPRGGRRRQSKFPRTSSAGKITKARRRSSQSPSGAKIEEMLISPSGSSTSSRKKKTPPKRSSNLRKRLSVIAEDSRESISTRRRSRSATRSASRSSSTSATTGETQTDCLEAQDVSLRSSLRENGFALKQLLKKSDAIAPDRGGNVYLAHATNVHPPRDVVLKILRRDFAPRTRRQFFLPQEYYICRDLCNTKKAAHPNIVEFHMPLLLLGSRVCFPMERCSGGDLLQMLYREKKLPETALRGFFSQALDAVQFLHSKEIAHLDLKCEHFLLDGGGSGNVRVRICGFGWATKFDPGRLEEDIYCQTVGYTPPEVVRRHPYDPTKADVFALGATLYILCTGKFPNPRLLELMGKGSPNFPRTPEVSAQLKELVRAMMDADWSRRLELREDETCNHLGDTPTPLSVRPHKGAVMPQLQSQYLISCLPKAISGRIYRDEAEKQQVATNNYATKIVQSVTTPEGNHGLIPKSTFRKMEEAVEGQVQYFQLHSDLETDVKVVISRESLETHVSESDDETEDSESDDEPHLSESDDETHDSESDEPHVSESGETHSSESDDETYASESREPQGSESYETHASESEEETHASESEEETHASESDGEHQVSESDEPQVSESDEPHVSESGETHVTENDDKTHMHVSESDEPYVSESGETHVTVNDDETHMHLSGSDEPHESKSGDETRVSESGEGTSYNSLPTASAVDPDESESAGRRKKHTCPYCGYKTWHGGHMREHKRVHTGERPFKCKRCDYSASRVAHLNYHIMAKHPCGCGFAVKKREAQKKYKKVPRPRDRARPHHCELCSYAATEKATLVRHLMSKHSDYRPFTCDLCGFSAVRKYSLQSHMASHQGIKQYKCTVCTYSTNILPNLDRHMFTHTGEKPFKCSMCDYAASRKARIQLHEATHTGYKPHKCDQCNYAAGQLSNLKLHIARHHTGEKRFRCDICDYSTVRIHYLKMHMANHTNNKPYKCEVCDYASATKGNLKKHNDSIKHKLAMIRLGLCDISSLFTGATGKRTRVQLYKGGPAPEASAKTPPCDDSGCNSSETQSANHVEAQSLYESVPMDL
ncbi:hypothetical protein Bbelb_087660 [Branchiostoma belcheri]|nr:hypothetical protein Bbelb_087660 [Branchiostoma belcheri]